MSSIGRPRCFDEEKALDQAMRVFWAKGYEGASLSQLTEAMAIKPASLYAAFGNKRDLFRKTLERYRARHLTFVSDALREPTAVGVARRLLRGSATFLTRPNFPPACMSIQTLAASDEGDGIHEELISLRTSAQRDLRKRFARAKREGDLPQQANPASLARFITAVCQGMNIQSINGASRKELLDLANVSLLAWRVIVTSGTKNTHIAEPVNIRDFAKSHLSRS